MSVHEDEDQRSLRLFRETLRDFREGRTQPKTGQQVVDEHLSDDLTAGYRKSRGWNPEPGPTTRISCELPRDLVKRLNRQARKMGVQRSQLIEAAVEGLVREFEAIDEGTQT